MIYDVTKMLGDEYRDATVKSHVYKVSSSAIVVGAPSDVGGYVISYISGSFQSYDCNPSREVTFGDFGIYLRVGGFDYLDLIIPEPAVGEPNKVVGYIELTSPKRLQIMPPNNSYGECEISLDIWTPSYLRSVKYGL